MTDKDRVAMLHAAIEKYFKPIAGGAGYAEGKAKVEGLRKAYLKTGGKGPTPRSSWFELELPQATAPELGPSSLTTSAPPSDQGGGAE